MKYYEVKKEYDQHYKNPRIHDSNILIAGELYTEKEIEKEKLNLAFFNIVDLPKQKSYFIFGIRKNLLQREV